MKTALLVIDVQKGMFLEGSPVKNGQDLIVKMKSLLSKARSKGIPIYYIQHNETEGAPLQTGTKGWEIHDDIKPTKDDVTIQKTTPDSFHGTSLEEELKKRGIEHLILTGIQTEICVDTTCRRAFSEGYKVSVVSDAHGTWDTEDLTAEQIINHHNGVLRWFADIQTEKEITFG
ncbi:cysteine hydrolase [Rossellomorea aquimaris]|uniref:cysteine hydrolase family protein n=1 Tax=Rossellomorea aquimaris TaxID=189382 RepID=UPI001CD32A8F|nr:cysteine hydrolase family protein [Rossellomorea aquimaris]MCA1053730.1 cysteine hydrolase [Rossellomorea aquimaris]